MHRKVSVVACRANGQNPSVYCLSKRDFKLIVEKGRDLKSMKMLQVISDAQKYLVKDRVTIINYYRGAVNYRCSFTYCIHFHPLLFWLASRLPFYTRRRYFKKESHHSVHIHHSKWAGRSHPGHWILISNASDRQRERISYLSRWDFIHVPWRLFWWGEIPTQCWEKFSNICGSEWSHIVCDLSDSVWWWKDFWSSEDMDKEWC